LQTLQTDLIQLVSNFHQLFSYTYSIVDHSAFSHWWEQPVLWLSQKVRFLPLNPYFYQQSIVSEQNRGDIRNRLVELHLTIYKKECFSKFFLSLWRKSSRKWVILYFSNATKGAHLIKLKYLPLVHIHVNLSLAINVVSHQSPKTKLRVIRKTPLLARNRYFFPCNRFVMEKERNTRNQRLKLRQMRCSMINFLTRKVLENLGWGPPQMIFVNNLFFQKTVYFIKLDVLSEI
jgi:hypothetical protein